MTASVDAGACDVDESDLGVQVRLALLELEADLDDEMASALLGLCGHFL